MGTFDKHLFHPSGIGSLMSNKQGKKDTTCLEELGETARKELQKIWIEATYGRRKEIDSKFIDKGNLEEESTITLYSRVKKKFFKKNEVTVSNEYFIGTPDSFTGEEIMKAEEIQDFKTSWDIFTFHESKFGPLDKGYEYQLNCYQDITSTRTARLIYGLVDTPLRLIEDEKRRLAWKMGLIDPHIDPLYKKRAELIDLCMVYPDIPMEKRIHEITIPYNSELVGSVKKRVPIWREYLNTLDK